jgi:hypothetical protein
MRLHEIEVKLRATQRELGLKKAANEGLMAQANVLIRGNAYFQPQINGSARDD